MSKSVSIIAFLPSGKSKVYSSYRAASRELSGDGTDRRRSSIVNKAIKRDGGSVGSVWVQGTRMASLGV